MLLGIIFFPISARLSPVVVRSRPLLWGPCGIRGRPVLAMTAPRQEDNAAPQRFKMRCFILQSSKLAQSPLQGKNESGNERRQRGADPLWNLDYAILRQVPTLPWSNRFRGMFATFPDPRKESEGALSLQYPSQGARRITIPGQTDPITYSELSGTTYQQYALHSRI